MLDYAKVDNKLAASQLDIGESSNVAQVGLSYTFNEFGKQYDEYVAILAILAQVSVDSSKRVFDVDVHSEIQRIKSEMNVDKNGIPAFFAGINPSKRKKVNPHIVCPMNSVYKMKNPNKQPTTIIPMQEFFVPHKNEVHKATSRKVEKFIQDFAKELNAYNAQEDKRDHNDYLLLRNDYDDLIRNLRGLSLSNKYVGLMSWLINRAFEITSGAKRNSEKMQSTLNKNRAILLKVLYDLNPKTFKKCFKTCPLN